MKSYEEITKKLLERRERYIADKKKQIKRTIAIIVPTCCVTLAVLLAFGFRNGDDLKDPLQLPTEEPIVNDFSEKDDVNVTEKENIASDDKDKETGNKKPGKHSNKPDKNTTDATDDVSEGIMDYPDKHHSHSNNKDHSQDLTHIVTENPDADKWIQKIVVTQMPIKTVYYPGDTFDFRGLEVTGYFSTGEVEDITPYIQIYNTKAYAVSDKYSIYIEYTDNSDAINLAYTTFYFKVIEPSLDISKKSVSLNVGECTDNSAIIDAKNCNITWHSTDTSVVTVDNDGNITAVGSGSASVYAVISFNYDSDNCAFRKESPRCTVTVN